MRKVEVVSRGLWSVKMVRGSQQRFVVSEEFKVRGSQQRFVVSEEFKVRGSQQRFVVSEEEEG